MNPKSAAKAIKEIHKGEQHQEEILQYQQSVQVFASTVDQIGPNILSTIPGISIDDANYILEGMNIFLLKIRDGFTFKGYHSNTRRNSR